ncbi:MAG: hypothetical protein EXR07_19755, partial [Acetobacteraceae bacterium]|nr:hypothetical protein [Acetobacteraceae bacterium]
MKPIWTILACLLVAAACAPSAARTPGLAIESGGSWRDQIHYVPMRDKDGGSHPIYTRICRPRGEAPARVVLINHGSPPNASARPGMQPSRCESEAVHWFLSRGYPVVFGMRRGYGETGGDWAENYARAGRESACDLDALLNYASALPYARPDGVVVVGQSAGGWAANAYNSVPHPKVIAMVSMAGGPGGHVNNVPHHYCPEFSERTVPKCLTYNGFSTILGGVGLKLVAVCPTLVRGGLTHERR